jgi:hypothetical protein
MAPKLKTVIRLTKFRLKFLPKKFCTVFGQRMPPIFRRLAAKVSRGSPLSRSALQNPLLSAVSFYGTN